MIKNIVFDFGGVLIDWNPEYLYKSVFEEKAEMNFFLENVCTPEWNLQQDAGRSLVKATRELQKLHPKYKNEIQLFYDKWTSMLGGQIDKNVALIKPLKEKYKLYGLTNWSSETFPKALEMYSFFQEIDGIIVSGTEKLMKPNQRIYELLLSRFGLNASECLFIDDNINNIRTAKELGFSTIHFTDGVNLKEELYQKNIL